MTIQLSADYLIIGTGAVGMAFADTLLSENETATLIMVDRHAKPGGHWTIAYPFVKLHQPSAFYGVASRELSRPGLVTEGLNKGMHHLATGAEINAYFQSVMEDRFLPSGRVQYFPSCNFTGDFDQRLTFTSLDDGTDYTVDANRVVDATYLQNTVPANHTPNFDIADGVAFVPVNGLADRTEPPQDVVVIGGGKTGMDAIIYLLENGTTPEAIRWIMPRDGWLIDRANTQPGQDFFGNTIGAQAAQMEAIAAASSVDNLFERLESAGVLLRLDQSIKPKMFHGATISRAEAEELRRVKNVIRMGRVQSIQADRIILDEGELPTDANTLHVDCSASAIMNLATKPIFQGKRITPQTVRSYQPVFSASMVAHIEATRDTEAEKNQLCGVVPLPNHDTDWLRIMIPFMMNQYQWSRDPQIRAFVESNRLDGFAQMVRSVDENDTEKRAILKRLKDNSMAAMMNLQKMVGELDNAAKAKV